ncbi:hypothetical protein J1614_012245 [Plenodomus biglobosus]|nr:hypothetical protein J1614_012245 [Plenodomus biglobosus]
MYGPWDDCAIATNEGRLLEPSLGYLDYAASNTSSESEIQLASDRLEAHAETEHGKPTQEMFIQTPAMYNASTTTTTTTGSLSAFMYPTKASPEMESSSSVFTTAPTMEFGEDASPISPLQTRFNLNTTLIDSNNFSTLPGHYLRDKVDIPQARYESSSPAQVPSSSGGSRRSENAEPGSARAIYLEKNRKAASKCRNKQKMQQEDLVETARDVERRNFLLKAEVEVLRGVMQELMMVVGQHNDCADGRLRAYVQREADRLASNAARVPYMAPLPRAQAGSTSSTLSTGDKLKRLARASCPQTRL